MLVCCKQALRLIALFMALVLYFLGAASPPLAALTGGLARLNALTTRDYNDWLPPYYNCAGTLCKVYRRSRKKNSLGT